jgi:Protein of unknown function (DUF2924)
MVQRTQDAAAIEAEVDQIRSLGIDALRRRWRLMFGTQPPKGLTKDLTARIIAYRIQEEAFGGLDPATAKLLRRLADGKKPDELKRRLKPGTMLIREYGGKRHTVTVAADGFVWNGKTYSSLSVIAREITGTTWNGPRFFGLRVLGSDQSAEPLSSAISSGRPTKARRRSRSSVQASPSGPRLGGQDG